MRIDRWRGCGVPTIWPGPFLAQPSLPPLRAAKERACSASPLNVLFPRSHSPPRRPRRPCSSSPSCRPRPRRPRPLRRPRPPPPRHPPGSLGGRAPRAPAEEEEEPGRREESGREAGEAAAAEEESETGKSDGRGWPDSGDGRKKEGASTHLEGVGVDGVHAVRVDLDSGVEGAAVVSRERRVEEKGRKEPTRRRAGRWTGLARPGAAAGSDENRYGCICTGL